MRFTTNISNPSSGKSNLRAALVDFVGIEDMMKIDREDKYKNCKINNSSSPLLRFMKELRNYEVHLGSNAINRKDVKIYYEGSPDKTFDYDYPIITNLDAKEFMKLDCCAKHKMYDSIEVQAMIDYFNNAQSAWGVAYLLRKGINHYLSGIQLKLEIR